MVHNITWSLQAEFPVIAIQWEALEIQTERWRYGEVDMKYVKDREAGWTQVVIRRRKMSVRSEDVDNSQNANVRLNLIEG